MFSFAFFFMYPRETNGILGMQYTIISSSWSDSV